MDFSQIGVTISDWAHDNGWQLAVTVVLLAVYLVLHPSFKRGNFIRIFEADNYVEGYISDVMLFGTRLVTEDREVVIYPNNLMLGRPALINPRSPTAAGRHLKVSGAR